MEKEEIEKKIQALANTTGQPYVCNCLSRINFAEERHNIYKNINFELNRLRLRYAETTREKSKRKTISDLERMFHLAEQMYTIALESLKTRDKSLAKQAEKIEEQIDAMERELRDGHIARMEAGICSPQADTVFVETIRNLERIGDHADNIALDVVVEY